MFRYALEQLFDYMFQYLVSNLLSNRENDVQQITTIESLPTTENKEPRNQGIVHDGTLPAFDRPVDNLDKCFHIQVCYMDPVQKQMVNYNMTVKRSMKVADVKKELCDQLKDKDIDSWSNLAILFMGKELANNLEISGCDLGDYSMLHALDYTKVTRNKGSTTENTAQNDTALSKLPTKLTTIENPETSHDHFELKSTQSSFPDNGGKEKMYFFVYCQPCNAMRPGKLRVACSECENGSILFKREPQDWNDVLLDGQIECKCYTPSCTGEMARFYFKCVDEKGHQGSSKEALKSTSLVTPLNRLRRNNIGVSCLACMDKTVEVVLVFPCDHVICTECFRDYCKTALSERSFVWMDKVDSLGYTLNCPIDCDNSWIESSHLNLLDDHHYSLYSKFSSEELVLKNGGILCPYENCDSAYYPPTMPPPACEVTSCQKCQLVYCVLCTYEGLYAKVNCPFESLIAQTNDELCKSAKKSTQKAPSSTYLASLVEKFSLLRCLTSRVSAGTATEASRWQDTMSRLKIREISKPCPNCCTPTERDGGCMHMVCTRKRCNYNWCWICLTEWNTECMSTHWFG